MIIGVDVVPERLELARSLRLRDFVLGSGPDNETEVRDLTHSHGVERAVDCSANKTARAPLFEPRASGEKLRLSVREEQ